LHGRCVRNPSKSPRARSRSHAHRALIRSEVRLMLLHYIGIKSGSANRRIGRQARRVSSSAAPL
jgi:hypothetical protein